jgi:hypothetical protein
LGCLGPAGPRVLCPFRSAPVSPACLVVVLVVLRARPRSSIPSPLTPFFLSRYWRVSPNQPPGYAEGWLEGSPSQDIHRKIALVAALVHGRLLFRRGCIEGGGGVVGRHKEVRKFGIEGTGNFQCFDDGREVRGTRAPYRRPSCCRRKEGCSSRGLRCQSMR